MSFAAPLHTERHPQAEPPSRLSWLVFEAKRQGLQLQRRVQDARGEARRLPLADEKGFPRVAGRSQTALWISTGEAERRFERGKVQNLRVAGAALDGLAIPAGELFSFWRHVGPPTAARGFAEGRMLQQGCMVASMGGGLCQLSNSLYDAALQAGCEIVERHRHSRVVPGSQAERGRDATVAWNYVDLRFRAPVALRLGVRLDEEALVVTLSQASEAEPPTARQEMAEEPVLPTAASCGSCANIGCHLHEGTSGLV